MVMASLWEPGLQLLELVDNSEWLAALGLMAKPQDFSLAAAGCMDCTLPKNSHALP
jgi:hypothetical protein